MKESSARDIAILMKKIEISDSVFVFKPMGIIQGNYNPESDFFCDMNGNEIPPITDIEAVYDCDKEYFFTDEIRKVDLKLIYPSSSLKEAKINHFEFSKEFLWIVFVTDNEELEIMRFPIDEAICLIDDYPELFDYKLEKKSDNLSDFYKTIDLANFKPLDETEEITVDVVQTETIVKEHKKGTIYNDQNDDEIDWDEIQNYIMNGHVEPNQNYENPSYEEQEGKVRKFKIKKEQPKNNFEKIDALDMYKYITDRVKGQDDAVKEVITLFLINKVNVYSSGNLTRILLTGDPGTGKTKIIETLMEYLNLKYPLIFPMKRVNATDLISNQENNSKFMEIFVDLFLTAQGNFQNYEELIEYVEENAILFIDNLDKINEKMPFEHTLNTMIDFLNGITIKFGIEEEIYNLNSSKLTIFAAGSFNKTNQSKLKKTVGFQYEDEHIQIDEIDYGIIPEELINSFHNIIKLNSATKEMLTTILNDSKDGSLNQMKLQLEKIGIILKCDESFIDELVLKAETLGKGAKTLRSLITESLKELIWQALVEKEPSEATVTKETVNDPKVYVLNKKKKGKQ